jgi:hypothetical protein
MATITLDLSTAQDKQTLNDLLDKIRHSNRVFTTSFIKQNRELRQINGMCKVLKEIKGNGTAAMSAKSKRTNHNLFSCYEVQVTKVEKKLAADQNEQPKTKGWKNIQIDNIKNVRFGGDDYECINNTLIVKP